MLRAVADTHTVIWYLYDDPRLSTTARTAIESAAADGHQVGCSAITLAEIVYLVEKGRIHPAAFSRLMSALDLPGAVLRELPLDRTVASALPTIDRERVPDLPDRMIAATARLYDVPLITRDRQIRTAGLQTIW
ncbi:MAG TPA: type II toxin-antitoxin system VapC family toxin [Thermomicrobiaceae bacterium]|nr:type II toxin-antitoxin system VapC family toxin [Thermomicrobiaceae bacterium]